MSEYYDKQGNPMSLKEWGAALEDHVNKRVAGTDLPNGKWVSTIWLGLDHSFGEGPPLIFETMVFGRGDDGEIDWSELDCDRYSTMEEAQAGHERMVAKWGAA